MLKKILFTCSMVFMLLLMVACKTDKKDTKEYPRFSDINIAESKTVEGAIDVFVKALDNDAILYVIVVAKDSKAPTHEDIKKHEAYGDVAVVSYLEGAGTIYRTIEGLEEATSYDVYVTIEKDKTFVKEYYKTTCLTKTKDEVLDKGSGTNEDPYKIFTIEDLELVASDTERLSAFYSLQNDLDLSAKYGKDKASFVPLSWQTGSLKAFNGYFNGNGHSIKNLYIQEARESVGLFGQLGEEGTVANLVLENPYVATLGQRLGAVVGYNKGSVINVSVVGGKVESLAAESANAKVGGIVGDMYESGSILRCVSKTEVVASGNNVGGIVGSADASVGKTKALEIKNCYSLSNVITKGKYVGGIIGYARCIEIENCYSIGTIEGGEGVGGVAGYLQHRKDSPIVPSIKNCFTLGSTITVTWASQSNKSGYVVGNRSTSNNTNPVYENLYYADTTLSGNQKKPEAMDTEVDSTNFKDKEWLNTKVGIECNDVYWTMLEGAGRPTLKAATWDDGAYATPLQIREVKLSSKERNQISISTSSTAGEIYYVVVLSTAKAPTAEEIIAQKSYGDVELKAFGKSEASTLSVTVDQLLDETSYTVYAVAKDEAKVTTVVSNTIKTLPAPILLAVSYEVSDGTVLGQIQIAITSNKNATTYYKVSKEQLECTKEDMLEFDSTTSKKITIDDLDENTKYFIYLYSKTEDEDVLIVEKEFTTAADPIDFEVEVDFTKTTNAGELALEITSNKENATIWYILSKDLDKTYTKEELMEQGELYANSKVIFDGLENNTEYKIFVYAKTKTREIEIKTLTTTTLDAKYEQFADYFVGDWNQPGLYDKNGSSHTMPEAVKETGKVISVLDHGATANQSNFDNYEAFKAAIAEANAGDVVYIPNGTYYFKASAKENGYYAHIHLKANVTLKGESEAGVILVSCFDPQDNMDKQTTVIAVTNAKNVAIKNLTVTSNTEDLGYDNTDSNLTTDIYTGPKYGITVASSTSIASSEEQASNVRIEGVTVEKFRRAGVRIAMAQEVVVKKSTFKNATCLGGGGAGYGVCIQGNTHDVDVTDTILDTRFNVVEECSFVGPYLRHGALIQYYAHNNLIHNNQFDDILLDSIDLHGEDEYSNEICHNEIRNTRRGAAVGLGNTGATHDATGRNNFIHDNQIDGGARAIDIMLNTPNTVIFNNSITNVAKGITCTEANGTRIVENTFESITGDSIAVHYSYVWGAANQGIPQDYLLKGNTFTACGKGIVIDIHGENFTMEENTFEGIAEGNQIVDTTETFDLPDNNLAIEVTKEETEFKYNLVVTTTQENISIYYLISESSTAPTKEEVLAETPSNTGITTLEGLNYGTTYYVYVICTTDKLTSVILSTSFTTEEAPVTPLTITAKLTSNTADGVTAKYAQAAATFTTVENAVVHYLLTDKALENVTLEDIDNGNDGNIVCKGIAEDKVLFTGLHSETTYYLYAYAELEERTKIATSREITTAAYRNFNRDLPARGTINIFNAEDFYKYIEFENVGLTTKADGTIEKPSDSAKVFLFGDIYLDETKKVDMIVDTFKGTFDGQGFTIYNLTMESDASENLGLYKNINGSGATPGMFKNTTFVNAKITNTYAGATTSNAGNGIVCSELRGIVENVIIIDSEIVVSQLDSRVGAIVGRFTNNVSVTYTAYISNCGIYNTTVSGGTKNIGGAIGLAAYSNPYTTSEAGTPIYVSDLYVQANIISTSTQSSVGGVIGVSEILVKNVVSDIQLYEEGKLRKDSQIIGTIQNSSKETSKSKITSCISYGKGTLVRSWKKGEELYEKLYEVGTSNSDSSEAPKQDVIALDEITTEWISAYTTFDLENVWMLTEDHQLRLRLGGNIQ